MLFTSIIICLSVCVNMYMLECKQRSKNNFGELLFYFAEKGSLLFLPCCEHCRLGGSQASGGFSVSHQSV